MKLLLPGQLVSAGLDKKEIGMTSYKEHRDKVGNTVGVVSWLTVLTLTISLLLGASQAGAMGRARFIKHLSSKDAKQLLQSLEWKRYQASQINIAKINLSESEGWQDSAVILDLKGDQWRVEFPKDYFLSANRFFYVDGSNPRPVEGDARGAILALLKRNRNRLKVYHVRLGGTESPVRAIILTPYDIQVSTHGNIIQIKLDNQDPHDRQG